jgi:uncharacterized protein YkwD
MGVLLPARPQRGRRGNAEASFSTRFQSLKGASMFRRTSRRSPFGAAAALLALLAAAHTLPAQDNAPTVRVEVTNETAKPVDLALVGPDGKDYGPTRSVQPGRTYRTSNRSLPGESAKGWKWVVRDPDTGRVLKDVKADRPQRSITISKGKRSDVPADSGPAQTPQDKGQGAAQSRPAAVFNRRAPETPQAKGQAAAGGNRAELLRLINQHRQANGQGPLSTDASLTRAAQDHSAWMQSTGTFSHTGKDGSSFFDRIQAAGGRANASAENIARASTPQAVFDLWKNSAGHNRNMLGAYRKIGLGRQGDYYTAVFTD